MVSIDAEFFHRKKKYSLLPENNQKRPLLKGGKSTEKGAKKCGDSDIDFGN